MAKRPFAQSHPVWYSIAKIALGTLATILTPIIGFFLLMGLILFALGDGESLGTDANVAVIPLKGTIVGDRQSSFGFDGVASSDVVALIEKADKEDDIKAIIFDINSGGGSAVASAEIVDAVQKAEKPTVAVIRETGASGAFWIATSADTVFAHPLSVTGSIGVISSYLEFSGLLDRYNVTYQRLIAGSHKDTGSPYKKLTDEERGLLQGKIDIIHDAFISSVATNRGLAPEKVRAVADGFIMLGTEAKEQGFVDQLGTMEDAKDYLGAQLNITVETKVYKKEAGLLEMFSQVAVQPFYFVGRGVGDSLTQVRNQGVPIV